MRIGGRDMVVVLTHVSGGQAGQREILDADRIRLGRAPDNDVIFTSQDLRASAHHAEIFLDGDRFLIQDLDSTNGTYLSGSRIKREEIHPGQIVQCGRRGPQLLFELKPKGEGAQLNQRPWTKGTTISTTPLALSESASEARRGPRRFGRQTMQLVVETAVRRASSRWLRITAVLAGLTLIAVGALVYVSLMGPNPEAPAPAQSARVFSDIAHRNQAAVVLVTLNFQLVDRNGSVVTRGISEGTGFAIGTQGYIATNYHIVRPWEFDRRLRSLPVAPEATSLTVVFADQKASATIPATVFRKSKQLDLAILAITPPPGMPVVEGLETNVAKVQQGDEVAFIGFPFGSDLLTTTRQDRATTTFRRTTISKVTEDLIQLDADIQTGLSGSPIFNLAGRVIGIVVAEVQDEIGARSLPIGLGVPIKKVLDLLEQAGAR